MKIPVQIYLEFNHLHGIPRYETDGAAGQIAQYGGDVWVEGLGKCGCEGGNATENFPVNFREIGVSVECEEQE